MDPLAAVAAFSTPGWCERDRRRALRAERLARRLAAPAIGPLDDGSGDGARGNAMLT